jgi:histidinol-phosphate aminotransferase
MKPHYDKPPELYDGLRLHQNENTGGCSPRVVEALARLRPDQIGFYPPYSEAIARCAKYYGVDEDTVTLVNGLDEGVMALAVTMLRSAPGDHAPEAIIPEPAFEIFHFDTIVAGGRAVQVMPKPDFVFALDEVLAAITPRTRLVFLTNPNNPTGVPVPLEAIRTIANEVPAGAVVFVDEAYAEFAGTTIIPELKSFPNMIVGRTFSKAFGLAGIRIGCLIGAPETLEPIRHAIPVYSVNIAAVVAVQAALSDRAHVDDYVRQVEESRALLYAACDRLGVGYWTSAANFVLVLVGERAGELVTAAAMRGVYVRDRSTEPGCSGCIRVATGIVEHTKQFIDIMEEVLCAAP